MTLITFDANGRPLWKIVKTSEHNRHHVEFNRCEFTTFDLAWFKRPLSAERSD